MIFCKVRDEGGRRHAVEHTVVLRREEQRPGELDVALVEHLLLRALTAVMDGKIREGKHWSGAAFALLGEAERAD